MPSSIRIDTDVPMEMRDDTLLRADIYRPDDNNKHPVIFQRAYFKMYSRMLHIDIMNATNSGYALVSQVVRGRGTSEGDWSPENAAIVEAQDGYDSVEWIASQSWCDGNIGVMGYSHSGGMAAQIGMENPPHLKAIAPWSSGVGRRRQGSPGGFRPANTGGVISFITALLWIINEASDVINRLGKKGQDVSEMRRAFEWAMNNPEEYINFLPLKDIPFARFESVGRLWTFRLRGIPQTTPQQVPVEEENPYEKIVVPSSHLCGWYDGVATASFNSFKNIQKQGGSEFARQSTHIISGPWPHLGELLPYLGAMHFGAEASIRSASDQAIEFFNKYLQGKDIKIPPVRYFLMGKNQWQEADTWPLPQTQWQRFYLHSKGNANTAAGDGVLSRDEPAASEPPDTFIYDPHNPVPTIGGAMVGFLPGIFGLMPGPLEQSHIEERGDVLCYTTPELKEDVEITGPLEVHLFAATSARDTDFTAKLIDVHPDGKSQNLVDGIKRARGLKSEDELELINPGDVYEYVITMGPTSQLFRKGHRIRIDISSSNFPQFDRNMNTGNPIGEDAVGISATQTVYHQSEYASFIDLPVIQR